MAFPHKEQLESSLGGLVKEFGLVIEDIKITKAGAKSAIRIAVDTADPRAERPDLDQLEELSREVSTQLDESEAKGEMSFGPGYTLELSTPGVDFPLTEQRHWVRNIGRLVRTQQGLRRIAQVDDEDVILITPDKKQPSVSRVRFADVAGAVVEVEFSPAPAAEADLVGLTIEAYGLSGAEDQQDSPAEN